MIANRQIGVRSTHPAPLAVAAAFCLLISTLAGCRAAVSQGESPTIGLGRAAMELPQPAPPARDPADPRWVTEAPTIDLFADQPLPSDTAGQGVPPRFDLQLESSCAPIINVPASASDPMCEAPLASSLECGEDCGVCRVVSNNREGTSRDEYLCDGGDRAVRARVRDNWRIDGLEVEDTIAHFDTLAGDVQIVPSSRACIYAPRFAAVRQVTRLVHEQVNDFAIDDRMLTAPVEEARTLEASAIKQPLAPARTVGTAIGTSLEAHQSGLLVDDVRAPIEARNQVLPYEGLKIVELGIIEDEETPLILEGFVAAQIWSAVEMAQVLIDNQLAYEQRGVGQAQAEIVYEMPEGKPRLRLVKLASESDALPGEVVHFVIRFDNIGNEPIGNVTIVDKLSPRLAYVADSQSCSIEAEFIADDRSGDALSLRWEIDEPLEAGEGGVIRFECRVR